MADFDNTNRGAIWKNDEKQEDKHPDFKGSLNVNGVEFWVSAWKREDGASAKAPALSFRIQPKDDKAKAAPSNPNQGPKRGNDDMDGDSIPF